MSKHYKPQEPSTVASDFLKAHHQDAMYLYHLNKNNTSQSYSYSMNNTSNNTSNTFIPQSRETVLSYANNAWEKCEALNEKIKSTDDDYLKSSLRRQKNLTAEECQEYLRVHSNKSNVAKDKEDYQAYRMKFVGMVENDIDLVRKYFGEFEKRNSETGHLENDMLLEARSFYKDIKTTIQEKLLSKNVSENSIGHAWQGNNHSSYLKYLDTCKTYESQIENLQQKIMWCGVWYDGEKRMSFTDTIPLEKKLNEHHAKGVDYLNKEKDKIITQIVDKGVMHQSYTDYRKLCEESDQSLVESKTLLEIQDLQKSFKENVEQKIDGYNLNEESKAYALDCFYSQSKKYLNKLTKINQSVEQLEKGLLDLGTSENTIPNFEKFESITNSLKEEKQKIIDWKNEVGHVTEEIISVVVKLVQDEDEMILEINDIYKNLEANINKTLVDKNIDEEVKEQVWQMPFYQLKYEKVLGKFKEHEDFIRSCQEKIRNSENLSQATNINNDLQKLHKEAMEELSFHKNQLITHFVTKGLLLSGLPIEESPIMRDIKTIPDGFKEKINKNFKDNLINEKVKLVVDELFNSKCSQYLDKLKFIEKSVQKLEHELLMSDNFKQAKGIIDGLNKQQTEIDKWKLDANNLIEQITSKAIEMSYQTEPVQPLVNMIPNQQNNLIIEESEIDLVIDDSLSIIPNEESPAILKIKSLFAGFEKKLNDSLNDNGDIINEKIKSAVYKIYHPKCKKHLEKLELIEKSIKKYEALPNSQKTEKIINHLKQRYKQIDKWEVDSDDLIETITIKALELSCKTEPEVNQQNNLHVQKLMDEMVELKNMVKMNQNPLGIPPIDSVHQDEYDSSFQDLNQPIKSSSWQIEGFSENNSIGGLVIQQPNVEPNVIQEDEKAKLKLKGEIKGEIKLIKMGIKNHMEDKIKEELSHIKTHLPEITNWLKLYSNSDHDYLNDKNNESLIIGELEKDFGGFDEWQ